MKKISTFLAVFCAVVLLAEPRAPCAQTITLDSISGTTFCLGDPFSVTFTATGTWGHANAFTVQLLDTSGSFNNNDFSNIGSFIDSLPGTFTLVTAIPKTALGSAHYRIRVIGANPYITSADNGSNIVVGYYPNAPEFGFRLNFGRANIGFIGVPFLGAPLSGGIYFMPSPPPTIDSVFCDFGADATPATAMGAYAVTIYEDTIVPPISYSTGGYKYVSVREVNTATGCMRMAYDTIYVFDCSPPVVPRSAVVLDSSVTIYSLDSNGRIYSPGTYWVNPGVTVTAWSESRDTFFAEAGATVVASEGDLIYLKPGAACVPGEGYDDGGNVIIYAAGASVPPKPNQPSEIQNEFECDSLTFDYSQAPPNSIMHINDNESVAPTEPVSQIELSPNPTNGVVTLQNIPMGSNVMVMNVLGESVKTENSRGNTNLTLDLSNVTPGTYYIRIASGNSVTTKKIVKE